MRYALACLFSLFATASFGQSPEETAKRYFSALETSDKEQLASVFFDDDRTACRIGKSIIAAAPMFYRSEESLFFEWVFERVPTRAEISAMTPMQAFAEYLCDSVPDDPMEVTRRTIVGVIYEREDLAHIVYRVDGSRRLDEESRDLLVCLKREGEWRIVVPFRTLQTYMNYVLTPEMEKLSLIREPSHGSEQTAKQPADGAPPAPAR